jgi:hypothetical protein
MIVVVLVIGGWLGWIVLLLGLDLAAGRLVARRNELVGTAVVEQKSYGNLGSSQSHSGQVTRRHTARNGRLRGDPLDDRDGIKEIYATCWRIPLII